MALESEDEIKKALEIDSWRNLSKDKVLRFAAMMPDMDQEVALKIIAQLPVFTRFAVETLNVLEKAHSKTLDFNKDSQANVHRAYQEVRETLTNQLAQDSLSPEDRKFLVEQIVDTANKEAEKDSENKRFLNGVLNKVAAGVGGAALLAVVFVGGQVVLQQGDDEEDS